MKTKRVITALMTVAILSGCFGCESKADGPEVPTTNALGAMTPQRALEYMKDTRNLTLIDVATAEMFSESHFSGAINIPQAELENRLNEIPLKSTVMLYSRQGTDAQAAYNMVLSSRTDLAELSYINGAPLIEDYNTWHTGGNDNGNGDNGDNGGDNGIEGEKLLGALTPQEALEYMKKTKDLVIVETREPQWISGGFTGSIKIPHTEMARRYNEIPKDRPVILHCGGGVVVPGAYRTLIENRPDIPQLSYIAGRPMFDEYNRWLQENK